MRILIFCLAILISFHASPKLEAASFVRGDANGNGSVSIDDIVYTLAHLFSGGPALCLDSMDANDDGSLSLVDPVYMLNYSFVGGANPSAPFPDCGTDPTMDSLDCVGPIVACPDLPPIISSIPNPSASVGSTYNYSISAQSQTGGSLEYMLITSPAASTIDPTSGLITWTPTQAQIGSQDFVVRITDSNGPFLDHSFSVTVSAGVQSFPLFPNPHFETDLAGEHMAIADFNNDGINDVILSSAIQNQYNVLLGLGGGELGDPISLVPSVYIPLSGISTGDFNNDGNIDIALSGTTVNSMGTAFIGFIQLMPGLGDGSFLDGISISPIETGILGTSLLLDLDQDNDLDLACLTIDDNGDHAITVLYRDSLGAYSAATSYSLPNEPANIRAGDLNQDGYPELVCTHQSSDEISVLYSSGGSSFTNLTQFTTGNNPIELELADLNMDNLLDIVTTNNPNAELSVLLNSGLGAFSPAIQHNVVGIPTKLQLTDLNNDSIPDLVVLEDTVASYIGVGDGSFTAQENTIISGNTIQAADMDGDGNMDICSYLLTTALTGKALLIRGEGNGDLASADAVLPSLAVRAHKYVDMNSDGLLDILLAKGPSTEVSVSLALGSGAYSPDVVYGNSGQLCNRILSADLNNDSLPDAIFNGQNSTEVFFNDGTGGLTHSQSLTTSNPFFVGDICMGDINNDGSTDLVLFNSGTQEMLIHTGSISGSFSAAQSMPANIYGKTTLLADMNNDGNLDILHGGGLSTSIVMALGNGNGTFGTFADIFAINPNDTYAVEDLNGDGNLDLAVSLSTGSAVDIWLGNGTGGFSLFASPNMPLANLSINIADFNNDGFFDIVCTGADFIGSMFIIEGDGSGTFSDVNRFAIPAISLGQLEMVDVDNDGDIDVTAPGSSSSGIQVLKNRLNP